MAKKNKTNIYDILKLLVQSVFKRVESTAGIVNVALGFLILFIISFVLFQPIIYYILLMLQSIINMILLILSKSVLPVETDSPNVIIALVICLSFLLAEIVFCSLLVRHHETTKKELQNQRQKTTSNQK